mgnify:CR=1 FL=1
MAAKRDDSTTNPAHSSLHARRRRLNEAQALERLDQLDTLIAEKLKDPEKDDVRGFARLFYKSTAPDDVCARSVEQLFGAVMTAWRDMATRMPGSATIDLVNPRMAEHGWSCPHTVVSVVTDDMPFIVASLTNALVGEGIQLHLVVHPVVETLRDARGARSAEGEPVRESVIYIEIDEQPEGKALDALRRRIEGVVSDVRACVEDWPQMLERISSVMEDFKAHPPALDTDEIDEVLAFLDWLKVGNFTFVGVRDYSFSDDDGGEMRLEPGEGLGVLRNPDVHVLRGASGDTAVTPQVRHYLRGPDPILTMKANIRSTVHRPVYLDYVGVKRFNDDGVAVGETRFVGLFTASAYTSSVMDIPHLRRKARAVMEEAGFGPDSHDGKALMNVLETFPRDELIQIDTETLYDYALGIMHLQERPRTRLFLRQDWFKRFCSALVYMPRERYNSELRAEVGKLLVRTLNGRLSAYYPSFGEAALARVHYIIGTDADTAIELDAEAVARLEEEIAEKVRDWRDVLNEALIEAKGEALGNSLYACYRNAFSVGYRAAFDPHIAVSDVELVERVKETGISELALYRRMEDQSSEARFKIFKAGDPVALSDCLPMLENLGVRVIAEAAFTIEPRGAEHVALHDFKIETQDGAPLELDAVRHHFEDAFACVWNGSCEDDGFNKLVLTAGLGWRDIVILRAYARYLRQTGTPFSQVFMEDALNAHGGIAARLVELFHARFDPAFDGDRSEAQNEICGAITAELDEVSSLDQDRMIRRFINLIRSTLRTNAYQHGEDGEAHPYLSFKLDSQAIDGLPLPRPHVEIFVYSPQVEGVHLRFGKVARGGLRWSDRREDFRTEVLGLVKAQQVKNAVIVPVGSKGGFVPKNLPAPSDRDAFMAEGISSYRTFISGLLDLTDNLDGDAVVPPAEVIRHDEDDPYLVVAADKGTASFSDYANDLSLARGFWLGDAFASGGKNGYDHKKMGITARGAWEAVKRHFRELGTDIQSEPFSVIGIGDMSGDVFGNGMLLSRQIRLVAAFDHRDIFIDPDPDPETGFVERERLFEKPRSSWQDYDRSLISDGGGVFSRAAKSIELTPQIKKLIETDADALAPADLIHALLQARCDLLWFGGIGTYVKAADETNADVGDKANDGLRVNGGTLKARVIGEGGNLGLTQKGRIEASRNGVKLNTDAVDNSAGVDCSDHEVNIKILLNKVVREGDLTEKQRDALLAEMTDDVARLVLDDNYRQTQALTLTEQRGTEALEIQARFMRALEREGRLNREVEFLPNDEEIETLLKSGGALTRPELCVLLAYAKLAIFDAILDSFLPDDPYLERELFLYFPDDLRERFDEAICGHRLRREIIATRLSNSIVNRGGPTLVSYVEEESGATIPDIVRAYAAARDAFGLRALWDAIDALDTKVDAAVQTRMLQRIRQLLRRTVLWLLANSGQPPEIDIEKTVSDFGPCLEELSDKLRECLIGEEREEFDQMRDELVGEGVPEDLAARIAGLEAMRAGPDIVEIARTLDVPVVETAKAYAVIGEETGLVYLREKASTLPSAHHWDRQAVRGISEGLFAHQRRMTEAALEVDAGAARDDGAEAARHYLTVRQAAFDRPRALIADMKKSDGVSLSELVVANMAFASL